MDKKSLASVPVLKTVLVKLRSRFIWRRIYDTFGIVSLPRGFLLGRSADAETRQNQQRKVKTADGRRDGDVATF
jgi:hypothetical protein